MTEPTIAEPNDSTPCVACRTPISRDASICPTCKSYQSNWKNRLQYFSSQITLITLTASAVFWLVTQGRVTFFPREGVAIISSNTAGSTVFVNRGDREVFLSHLTLWIPGRTSNWSAPELIINEKLAPASFLKKDWDPPKLKTGTFPEGKSPADFESSITKAANGDPCYEFVFFDEHDYDLRQLREMSVGTVNLFPVAGYLEYWPSDRSTARQLAVRGSGTVLECKRSVENPGKQ